MRNATYSFADVDWGAANARNDEKLLTYFVRVPAYQDVVLGRHRYVVGRKGSGKTALIERIRLAALHEHKGTWHISDLSLRNFPLQDVNDLRDKSYRDKAKYVPVWSFLIAVELARLVVRHESDAGSAHIKALREFLDANFEKNSGGFLSSLQRLKEKSGQILFSAFGGSASAGGKTSTQQTFTRNYQEATRMLLGNLRMIPSKSSYYVLIDDLDEGFRTGDTSLRLILLALLRAVEDTCADLGGADPHYRVVLALRDDIFDSLEDADLNKLDDYVARLQWTSEADPDKDRSRLSLREVVAARIRASIVLPDSTDPWTAVVEDTDPARPNGVTSLWTYIAHRTYERPRDILKFLMSCSKVCPKKGRLGFSHVEKAESDYSAWLYRELRDEIQSFLPIWKEAFQAISQLGSGKVRTNELRKQLEANPDVASWLEANKKTTDTILSMLFDYGIIGSLSGRKVWSFKYKDSALAWNPRSPSVIVHWGLGKKLRIVRDLQPDPE